MICLDCGRDFEEPAIIPICTHYEIENCPSEHGSVCPICKSERIEESVICEKCGKQFPEYDTYMGFCESCQDKLKDEFMKLIRDKFSKQEIDYLFDAAGEM